MSRYTRLYAERLAPVTGLPVEEVEGMLGTPPRPELGQLAFGCFSLAKARRQEWQPVQVAAGGGVMGSLSSSCWVARIGAGNRLRSSSQIGMMWSS
jgi:hypothetical protein